MDIYKTIRILSEESEKRKLAVLREDRIVPDPVVEAIDFAIAYMKGEETK